MLEPPSETGPVVDVDDAAYRRAFAVADELNVHGGGCVCPRCAGRLPGLLAELARALGDTDERNDGSTLPRRD